MQAYLLQCRTRRPGQHLGDIAKDIGAAQPGLVPRLPRQGVHRRHPRLAMFLQQQDFPLEQAASAGRVSPQGGALHLQTDKLAARVVLFLQPVGQDQPGRIILGILLGTSEKAGQ